LVLRERTKQILGKIQRILITPPPPMSYGTFLSAGEVITTDGKRIPMLVPMIIGQKLRKKGDVPIMLNFTTIRTPYGVVLRLLFIIDDDPKDPEERVYAEYVFCPDREIKKQLLGNLSLGFFVIDILEEQRQLLFQINDDMKNNIRRGLEIAMKENSQLKAKGKFDRKKAKEWAEQRVPVMEIL